jgi:outer membrane receptor protein involved in Fe transport
MPPHHGACRVPPHARRRSPRIAALRCVLVLAAGLGIAAAGAPPNVGLKGRRLADVLAELQRGGLKLVYSTAVVGEGLVVTVEPEATDPRAILDEILPPLGLEARRGPERSILIVQAVTPPVGILRGRVVSVGRGAALAGAQVRVHGTTLVTTTRPDGTFELTDVPIGSHQMSVNAPQFVEATLEDVRVVAGRTRRIEVALQAQPGLVEELLVTPGRYSLVEQDQAAILALDRDDAVLVPTIGGDVTRVLETLPGVSGADNSAAFNVRGSETGDVSLVLDGLELYEPFHLQAFQSPFSFIDSEVVDTIDFLRGGFTAEAGDRDGGFVRLSTRTPDEPYHAKLEAGTLKSGAAYAAPTRNGSLLLSARAWYPDTLAAIHLGEDQLRPRFQDLYLKYAHYLSPRTVLSAHLLLAHDELGFAESDGAEEVESRNSSGYLWLRALQSWSSSLLTETVLSGGRLERSRVGISEPEDERVAVDDERTVGFLGLRHEMSWEISSAHLVKAGIEVRPLDATYRYAIGPPDTPVETRVEPSGTSYAAHAAYRGAFTDHLAAELGLRWDGQTYAGDSQLSPRVNALWRPDERTELRLGLGDFYQSQRIYELDIEDGETTFRPAERSRQAELTLQHRLRGGVGIRVDVYARTLSDVHARSENLFSPVDLFPETEPDRVHIAPELSRFRGAEAMVQGAPGRPFSWWVSYAWSSAVDVIAGADTPRSWDQTHAGNFLVAYEWEGRWSLSLSGTAHTGWPTTPVSAQVTTLPDGSTEIEPVLGERNSARFGPYARLDLKAGRTFPLRDSRLQVFLEITNLTDRDNECCVDEFLFAPQPDGTVDVQPDLTYWNGFAPSFRVLWSF